MHFLSALSITAACIELVIAFLVWRLSRSPGWRRLRAFVAISLSAAAFTLNNLPTAIPGAPDWFLEWNRANYTFACIHLAAWIAYTRAGPDGHAVFTRFDRWLLGALGVLGLMALVPGTVMTSELREQTLSAYHITYRAPATAELAGFAGVALLAVMLLVFARFVKAARAGEAGAAAHITGFAIFFLSVANEVAVTLDLYNFIYTADLGFLAMVLVVLSEIVRRVTDDASALADLSTHLEREVAARTNELSEARNALLQAERLASLGQLAAGVGHEINNPLTSVHANLQMIQEYMAGDAHPADLREAVSDALDGSDRIRHVVGELRVFARAERDERMEPLLVSEVLSTAIKLSSHQLRHRARIVVEESTPLTVQADRARLGQVFLNLLVNAAQAIPDERAGRHDTVIRVRIDLPQPGEGVVEIQDCGMGIEPEHLPHIFEPYYTTRAHSGGTGLGLFISHGIVVKLGGHIEVQSKRGEGTTVSVCLPAVAQTPRAFAPEPAPPATRVAPPSVAPRLRVLIVDDEPGVGRVLSRMLRAHETEVVGDGASALQKLASDRRFDVILCDLMMPDVSGIDLYERLSQSDPELAQRVVFVTGGAVTERARAFLARPELRWLPKPVDAQALQGALCAVVGQKPNAAPPVRPSQTPGSHAAQ